MWNASHFLDYYLDDTKGNGVQSYLKVSPNAKYQSAKASASRLLKKPSVMQAMQQKLEKIEVVNKC
jgi:phage terminase small subunit